MMTMGELLAFNLKRLRKERGWTQERLAELAGLSLNSVQRAEGRIRFPREDNITALAQAFRLPESELFLDPEKDSSLKDERSPEPTLTDVMARFDRLEEKLVARPTSEKKPKTFHELALHYISYFEPEDVTEARRFIETAISQRLSPPDLSEKVVKDFEKHPGVLELIYLLGKEDHAPVQLFLHSLAKERIAKRREETKVFNARRASS
jgi:transcriptional regulator with XRE-family HTH domain